MPPTAGPTGFSRTSRGAEESDSGRTLRTTPRSDTPLRESISRFRRTTTDRHWSCSIVIMGSTSGASLASFENNGFWDSKTSSAASGSDRTSWDSWCARPTPFSGGRNGRRTVWRAAAATATATARTARTTNRKTKTQTSGPIRRCCWCRRGGAPVGTYCSMQTSNRCSEEPTCSPRNKLLRGASSGSTRRIRDDGRCMEWNRMDCPALGRYGTVRYQRQTPNNEPMGSSTHSE
mmetsp:Transcript_20707/g.57522  ORF Transcript_20707/g.57522 Transcript_20707/m.57522 type:complete len:234 (+) Transcript_20707:487-1188(+)